MESEFCGRLFEYSPDVLQPTKFSGNRIAEAAIAAGPQTVCDVCTGSGNIAVTILTELPEAKVVAIDISLDAVRMAMVNAVRHGVRDRLVAFVSDGMTGVAGKFDAITCNPPFWIEGEYEEYNVTGPRTWFTDGGKLLSEIVGQAATRLNPGGRLILECYAGQVAMLGFDKRWKVDVSGEGRIVLVNAQFA